MKVKLLHPYLNHERGEVVEYPKGVAQALIDSHRAVAVLETGTTGKMIGKPPRNKAVAITERK